MRERIWAIFITLAAAVCLVLPATAGDARTIPRRDAGPGDLHAETIELTAGSFLRATVDQDGVRAVLTLHDPDGKEVLSVDGPSDRRGLEILLYKVPATGAYRLAVRTRARGNYVLRIEVRETADPGEIAEAEGARIARLQAPEDRAAAGEHYHRARDFYRWSGRSVDEARALYALGALHVAADPDRALDFLGRALTIRQSLGDDLAVAETLNLIGHVERLRGELELAAEHFREALVLRRRRGDRCGQAQTLSNLALIDNVRGRPAVAQERLRSALVLCGEADEPELAAALSLNLGGAHEVLGETVAAATYFEQARLAFHHLGQRGHEATALSNLGAARRRLGQYRKAFASYRQALEILEDLGDRRRQATVLNNLGFAYLIVGEPETALEFFRRALPLRRETGDRRGEAITLNNLGRTANFLGNPGLALEFLAPALELRRAEKSRSGLATTLDQIGIARLRLGELGAAREVFAEALELRRAVGDASRLGLTLRRLAEVEMAAGQPEGARKLLEEALALHRQAGDSLGEAVTLPILARLERGSGDLAAARDHLDIALDRIESLRVTIDHPDLAAAFLAARHDAYADQIDLLMELHGRDGEAGHDRAAFAVAERSRSRGLLDFLDPAGVTERSARRLTPSPASAAEVAAVLDAETLILEFSLGETRSFVWAVTADELQSAELPPRADIEAAARQLHQFWSTVDIRGRKAEAAAAAELSQTLLGPVAELFSSAHRLAVVADGVLAHLPFAALPHPSTGGLLLTTHEVVGLPSASVWLASRRGDAGRRTAVGRVVVLADPVFGPIDPRLADVPAVETSRNEALDRLPATGREAEAIAALVPGDVRILRGFDAARTVLVGGLTEEVRILHLATHGRLDTQHPRHSGLFFSAYDRHGRALNGFLSLPEIYELELDADLVVLSGCATALGKEVRGEGLVGLARGFLLAGARRVVASLWRVRDQATAELMTHFYRALLHDGVPPAAALRQAQLALARDPAWNDPYFWAAFVHQGDWR